ncbi:hypothetical protein T4B_6554 [Trichinella pseudospiralis]|uniref:Uncharacterized protein n=1 Tax=Trichinella pseudospiralis TaxID=6337 RepID=A0A0V1JRN8_TRIPS|nr:hypothetical protein T4A_7019 [Trichinella pseudospiralis]KRZ33822.1 hypothetical protein T4B_6554 [Trichinella pseudospiralis]KRZ37648.1 hypothetical protein T4C_398 [Trichinella pseudospiralis]
MDGKQLLISLWYNLECTIYAPGSQGCQHSNVVTRSKYQYVPRCTLPQQKFIVGLRSGFAGPDDVVAVSGIALPGGCTSWTLPV